MKIPNFFRGAVPAAFLILFGAHQAVAEIFTIGMITYVPIHTPAVEGFKAGMAALGYVEGKNIRYLYHGPTEGTEEKIDAEVKRLLAQHVDLFFTAGNLATLRVKKAISGTEIPLLFTGGLRPVEDGIVESIRRPGGNTTGVRVVDTAIKTLEWLKNISPEIKKVFIPYNSADSVSGRTIDGLKAMAPRIGVDLVLQDLHSVEEAKAAIETLPDDIDAILRVPVPTLDMRNSELSQAAIRRGLPMVASLPLDDAVFMSCSMSLFDAGKMNARLADLIRKGTKPSDLPVETADPALTINLKTAAQIGVAVSDEILLQAKTILR